MELEPYFITAEHANLLSRSNSDRDYFGEIKKFVDKLIEDHCKQGKFDAFIDFNLMQFKEYTATDGLIEKLRDDLNSRGFATKNNTKNRIYISW